MRACAPSLHSGWWIPKCGCRSAPRALMRSAGFRRAGSQERPAGHRLCGPEANDLMGQEVSIRDEALQREWGWRFSDGRATGSGCHLRPGRGVCYRAWTEKGQRRGRTAGSAIGRMERWAVFAGDAKTVDGSCRLSRRPRRRSSPREIEPGRELCNPAFSAPSA